MFVKQPYMNPEAAVDPVQIGSHPSALDEGLTRGPWKTCPGPRSRRGVSQNSHNGRMIAISRAASLNQPGVNHIPRQPDASHLS